MTNYESLSKDKILFKEAKDYKVKDSKFRYQRIKIETIYPDGKKGDLVIQTPFLFSFGVNEKKSQETDNLVGVSIPVCLWENFSVPNPQERDFYDFICKITEVCRKHLEDEYCADASTLSLPLYYKQVEYVDKKGRKKTKRDESAAPVLDAKFIYSDKSKKILSLFKTKKAGGGGGRERVLFLFTI